MSSAELDSKLTQLLAVMVSRLPGDKKISAGVVQQLLRSKYSAVYPEEYIASHETFITAELDRLQAEKTSQAAAPPAPTKAEFSSSSSSDEDDDDDDDDDDEEDEEDSGSDDAEGSGDDEQHDDEDSDALDDDDDSDSSDDDDDGNPEKKKARLEEQAAFSASAGATSVADRCKAMVECLKKLSYRVRLPQENESLEDYLSNFLVPEFLKRKLDPVRYSAADVKRYRALKEVEFLQQDGASMNLDRRSRVGRGYAQVEVDAAAAAPTTAVNYPTSRLLDDDEDG